MPPFVCDGVLKPYFASSLTDIWYALNNMNYLLRNKLLTPLEFLQEHFNPDPLTLYIIISATFSQCKQTWPLIAIKHFSIGTRTAEAISYQSGHWANERFDDCNKGKDGLWTSLFFLFFSLVFWVDVWWSSILDDVTFATDKVPPYFHHECTTSRQWYIMLLKHLLGGFVAAFFKYMFTSAP